MKTVVLLGAGASVPAGLPTAQALTSQILQDLVSDDPLRFPVDRLARRCIEVVHKALLADGRGPDFEEILEILDLLADADTFPLGLAVRDWHPALQSLRNEVARSTDRPQYTYVGAGVEMRKSIARLVEPAEFRSLDYLAPLVEAHRAEGSLCVATLNYDTTVEAVGQKMTCPVSTGGIKLGWNPDTGLQFEPGSLKLLKLHGSVTWPQFGWRAGHLLPGGDETRWSAREVSSSPNKPVPAIIAGTAKLTATGPFMDLLVRFRQEVMESDRLVIVGYSFRDAHVNAVVRGFINMRYTPSAVSIVDPYLAIPRYEPDGSLLSQLEAAVNQSPGVVRLVRASAGEGLARVLQGDDGGGR